MPRFPGVIPAVTTPFASAGELDLPALERNVAGMLDAGMAGIVGTGTMGEAGSLSAVERRSVIAAIAGVVEGRAPVIAGVSSGTAAQSIAYATDAAEAGADALMCLPPLGYRGDPREVEAFFAAVTGAVDLPMMLYNNPEASGIDLPAEQVAAIARRVPGVVAVKECSGDARRIAAILDAGDGELEVLVGGDDWPLEGLCAGASGWISGVATVAPEACRELLERCTAGDLVAARRLNARLLPLARFDMTPKLVQYFKAGQDLVGRSGGPVRPPRMELTAAERAQLEAALVHLGLTAVA